MKWCHWQISILLTFGAIIIVGCTQGDPTLEGELPLMPTLDTSSISINSASATVTVSGACDARFQELWIGFNGTNWYPATTTPTSAAIQCSSTKRFTMTFDLSQPGIAALITFSPAAAATKFIYVRGKTKAGLTKSAVFAISYAPPVTPGSQDRVMLSAYSSSEQLATPGGTKLLHGRVGVVTTGNSLSSASFRLSTGLESP